MNYIIGALAVYKMVQVVDVMLPKEAMPWVKILFTVAVSYPTAFLLGTPNVAVAGCAIATLAGTVHAVLRLLVLMGDSMKRKATR